jgi:23S rRNA pseudouridine2605 synthase
MTEVSRERLNRFLARRGLASRRGADALIAAGRVSINGATASVGDTLDPGQDDVAVDGAPVAPPAPRRTLMLNKPAGVVTTVHDPQHRPTVMSLVETMPGMVPVGRLDVDSRGLLLLSSDGELVHRVTHPRYGVRKRYRVTLDREVAPVHLRRLVAGVDLDDGPARVLSARRASTAAGNVIEVSIAEGRKREVRRLCAAIGFDVVDLARVGIGPLRLGHLEPGAARPLTSNEERALYAGVGMSPP